MSRAACNIMGVLLSQEMKPENIPVQARAPLPSSSSRCVSRDHSLASGVRVCACVTSSFFSRMCCAVRHLVLPCVVCCLRCVCAARCFFSFAPSAPQRRSTRRVAPAVNSRRGGARGRGACFARRWRRARSAGAFRAHRRALGRRGARAAWVVRVVCSADRDKNQPQLLHPGFNRTTMTQKYAHIWDVEVQYTSERKRERERASRRSTRDAHTDGSLRRFTFTQRRVTAASHNDASPPPPPPPPPSDQRAVSSGTRATAITTTTTTTSRAPSSPPRARSACSTSPSRPTCRRPARSSTARTVSSSRGDRDLHRPAPPSGPGGGARGASGGASQAAPAASEVDVVSAEALRRSDGELTAAVEAGGRADVSGLCAGFVRRRAELIRSLCANKAAGKYRRGAPR